MSRVGKVPILLPKGVAVAVDGSRVSVKGPKGELSMDVMPQVSVEHGEDRLEIKRGGDGRAERSAQGLTRRLVANMVEGVSTGFSKKLEITGVGYRAEAKGDLVTLALGYSHAIVYQLPEGIAAKVENQTSLTISGIDRQKVGEVAAEIRKLRPPEPYKGKGIRYSDEYVRRKAGKAGASA